MPPTTLEPLAPSSHEAAAYLAVSRRTLSRLISARKISASKDGRRTLIDVASLKTYYDSLLKSDRAPIVLVQPVTGRRHGPCKGSARQ